MNAANLIIGPAYIEIDSVDLGFTTKDGLKFKESQKTVEYRGAQSTVIVASHRPEVDDTFSATFSELTLDNWALLSDLDNVSSGGTLQGDYPATLTQRACVITCAGPNGSTRVLTGTVTLRTPGEKVFSNDEYCGAPVEFGFIGDPTNNRLWTIVETAGSETAPVVSTYQKVTTPVSTDGGISGTETTITDGASSVAVGCALQVTFSEPIRLDMVNGERIFLLAVAANTVVAATVYNGCTTGARDFTKLVIVPTSSLSASTTYNLVVPAGLRSQEGLKLAAAAIMQFTTA